MLKAPIPWNDDERVEELLKLNILDTKSELAFDDLTRLATEICKTPISLVSLVDRERQWIKSKVGIEIEQTPRDVSFCGHVVNEESIFEIPDTHQDERFKDNPFCVGEKAIRYYAGFPLITSKGFKIGSFCVIDTVPSKLSDWQKSVLERLAKQTMLLIEANLRVQLLKDNEEKVHAIFEGSNDAIMIVDARGFIDCNKKTLELFKLPTKEEFFKYHPADLSPEFQPDGESSRVKASRLIDQVIKSGYQRFEWIHRRSDGEEFPTEIILTAFEKQGQRLVQATVRDMTEKVKLQTALDQERKITVHQSKLAALGQLAAGVGHEINNPVAIINGYTSVIEEELKNNHFTQQNVFEMIKNIKIASARIAVIVKSLKTFARSEKDLFLSFSVKDLLLESMGLFSDMYQRDGIKLEVNIEAHKNFQVMGNRGRMAEVISNLISNARDASEGMKDRLISINLSENSQSIQLNVTDSGKGIPEDIREKIFDPFFTTKDVNKGTGIGLSIVNAIIKEHEGKIRFETQINRGTTFTVEVPKI